MKNIAFLIFITCLLSSCNESFQQKIDKKRNQIANQIESEGYKFRERYQVSPENDSIKMIKEILTFNEKGNIISRAQIGNTRNEIKSLVEYELTEQGKIKSYTNFNTKTITNLSYDESGRVIESIQKDSLDNIYKTIYFDWEDNTCYQSVYGSDNHLVYEDTIVVDNWGNTIQKKSVNSTYSYDEEGNPIKIIEENTSSFDKIIIEKEFDEHIVTKETVYLPTGATLFFEYYYSK